MMHNGNWDHGMDGGGWWWMVILMVVFWGGLFGLALAFIRKPHQASPPSASGAQAILAERFARGEIEVDEYRSRLDALNHRPDSSGPR